MKAAFATIMNIPLLVSGQALDVLRVAVGGARDSCCRHPRGSCARRRRYLHAEVREDPDHPRAVQRTAERVCVCVCVSAACPPAEQVTAQSH